MSRSEQDSDRTGPGPAAHLPPERAPEAHLGDGQAMVMAASVWLAALVAPVAGPVVVARVEPAQPAAVAAALAGFALVGRRPWLLIVAVVALAGARAIAADHDHEPVTPGPFAGAVALVDDPSPLGAGWRVDARLGDGRRVEAWAYGAAGFELAPRSAGDQVYLSGRLRALPDEPWRRARHIVGRLDIAAIDGHRGPTGPRAVVEVVRSAVGRGADGVPERLRPLYLGLVIGDDRLQPASQQARFQAAGLAHLMAVSGQNVAFLLVVARPLLNLAGRRTRFVLTVVLLCGFAVATRAEPSVLRATVTAGIAAWAATGGHRQSGLRLLALAVTGLLLVDPFLAHSVGFRLSVAASAGILVLSPRISARLPLPTPVADALGVTVGAQIAVLPLLLTTFGPVSLASVPANLMGGWAAGAVMTWGLTAGVVAGVLPGPLPALVQSPATLLLLWLDGVASWAARLPLPLIDTRLALMATAAVVLAALGMVRRAPGRGLPGLLAVVAALATVGAATAAIPGPPQSVTPLEGGGMWVPGSSDHPSVLVVASDANDRLLDSLLAHRITSVDVVVATTGNARAARLVRSIGEVAPAGVILAPPLHRVVAARTVRQPVVLASVVPLRITPVPASRRPGRLEVELIPPAATDPAPPGSGTTPAPP